MRSLGAIVVGIGDYRLDRSQFPLLRYAGNDASEIVRYLQTCWPDADEACVIHIEEGDATEAAIKDAFARLREAGPYDLNLIFLSGHGYVDDLCAAYVLQPPHDSNAPTLLQPEGLDQFLSSVTASRTILILDCCFAEAIVRRMTFFAGLGSRDARLFIASSREDQRTWEDDDVRHGIFTAHLVDLLNTGSSIKLAWQHDHLDVDGELFPVLCDQVPLYVLEHKQARQEPVKGGVCARTVSLPVARTARRLKERSAFGTAVRRVRQIAMSAVLAGLVVMVFVYSFVYYAEIDRSGQIQLRHGSKWTAPIFQYLPSVRLATGIDSAEVSTDPVHRYAVQAGDVWGLWTHASRRGYRSWYDTLRPFLGANAAARYDVLVSGGMAHPVTRLNNESRPSDVVIAAWALLDRSEPKDLETLLGHLPGANRTSPLVTPFDARELDFEILDLRQQDLSTYADALRLVSAIDPDRAFVAYVGFLKACSMWLAHSSIEQHGREAQRRVAEDVGSTVETIAKARIDRGAPSPLGASMVATLEGLAASGHDRLARNALSRVVGKPAEMQGAIQLALSTFHGNSANRAEADALRQLRELLDGSPSALLAVETVYQRFVSAGGEEQSDLTAFLIAAGDRRSIPPSLMQTLLAKAKEAIDRDEDIFMDSEYARVLAHGIHQVPASSRPLVYRLIARVAAHRTPLSSTVAEIYTVLARQGFETDKMLLDIIDRAKLAKPESMTAELPLQGMAIVVGPGPWLEGLAIVGTRRRLPPDAVAVLERHSTDPAFRDVIIRALSQQPAWDIARQCWTNTCSQVLKAYDRDSAKRKLASDLLAEGLAALPRDQLLDALKSLDRERSSESEPEIRIAIGSARIAAQVARVRTTPIERRLFE
ncbi:MAG: hypothetical protein GEV05_12615 [Betaproteobacteria bacterium]|nr:hypothetical protein [Betaproteobacteria bacterium]